MRYATAEARKLPPNLFGLEELDPPKVAKVLVRMDPRLARRLKEIAQEEAALYFAERRKKKSVSRNDVIVRMLERGVAQYDVESGHKRPKK